MVIVMSDRLPSNLGAIITPKGPMARDARKRFEADVKVMASSLTLGSENVAIAPQEVVENIQQRHARIATARAILTGESFEPGPGAA